MTFLWWVSLAYGHVPNIYTASPTDDWCQIIEDALGGDYVFLTPGDYVGPCDIVGKVSEPVGEVTIVQSFDADELARIVHDGKSDYLLRVSGPGVLNILQLAFGPVPAGVEAVRVESGNDLMVRYNRFESGEGVGVGVEGDVTLLRILDNLFEAPVGPAVVVDCEPCALGRFEVDGNVIDGGTGGVVVSASAEGTVADNTIGQHQGTALSVTAPAAEVHRNFVEGAVRLDVASMANNIVDGDTEVVGGAVVHNTLLGAVTVSGPAQANATLVGDLGPGNVVCDDTCFAGRATRDFYPVVGSPLRAAAPIDPLVRLDFCGNPRVDPTSAGAIEGGGNEGFGPVDITYRSLFDCTVLPAVGGTGTGGDTAEPGGTPADTAATPLTIEEGGGCGCGVMPWSSKGPTGVLAGALALWVRRRRSRAVGRAVLG